MPTYTYRCQTCHNRFDRLQKISDAPMTTCPKCQGTVQRIPYPVGLLFQGAGFYCTDYGSSRLARASSESAYSSSAL